MSDLDSFAKELRRELGEPPEDFTQAQRARARALLRAPEPRRGWLLVPAVAALLAVAAAVALWAPSRETAPVERWLVAEELVAPFRLPDGSTIALAAGSRGRLSAREDGVRFDLHAGRGTFDVTPRKGQSFAVTAGKSEVRVVGTRFSVAFGPLDDVEVEVEHGVVSVQVPERTSPVQLEAGDRLKRTPGRMALFHGERRAVAPAPSATSAAPPVPPVLLSASPSARPVASVSRGLGELPAKELAELADQARLRGDSELAIRALNALLTRFPASPEARSGRFLLGRVYALKGERAKATEAFERYLASGRGAYENEAVGRLIELYSARGDVEKARAMARRYLAQAPSGPYRRLAESLVARTD